ncbi:TPA: AmmeMemoRadiSam system protein A [Candidatus Berkelbacteria bacterium]|uniref:AMMECR1 domain-containing protein n=1 Tax=Berkelbacteria bacterium GW2011_GWE1_39_12 TaxID=1618337 RepID=A0A0G4B4Q3_9BACT|nr:MAG: hypothetical protein UT28_C0001G0811 [Berkelbacteria bacterium GW2011_GWE1_39_12]HBO60322.1 AmmeMemoRadiSam system protein A [Candidatus Berkelbacteria bacterium]
MANIYTDLVKQTVEGYLTEEKLPTISNLPSPLAIRSSGCFVSIHTKDKDLLRGCIGTIMPTHKSLGGEIIANAIEAAFHDPRFKPIEKKELDKLKYSVDVLGKIEAVKSENELDPEKYGVIVRSNDLIRSGLLLPNLEGIKDTETQIQIAREKGGIATDEEVLLYRFTADRYE